MKGGTRGKGGNRSCLRCLVRRASTKPGSDGMLPRRGVERGGTPQVEATRLSTEGAADSVHEGLGLHHIVTKGEGFESHTDNGLKRELLGKEPVRGGTRTTRREHNWLANGMFLLKRGDLNPERQQLGKR